MYKLLYAFALLYSTSIFSQTLDGFMGIKFGSSMDSVKAIVLSKPGAELSTEYCNDHTLFFEGLKFAGHDIVLMGLKFIDNRLYSAMVGIKLSSSTKIFELYKEIKTELNKKYFKTGNDYEEYEYPYKKGDGLTERAIQKGKTKLYAYWEFKNPATESNFISLAVAAYGSNITLRYEHRALGKLAEGKEKAEKNKDY